MKLPNINCKIQVVSAVNPSGDAEKIKNSISNILPCCNILSENSSIIAESNDVQSLEKIYESVYSTKSQRVLQRQLDKHIDKNSTWFYLNKQAAFVDRVIVCEDADESPLGPLKIILTSSNIERIIDMLVLGH